MTKTDIRDLINCMIKAYRGFASSNKISSDIFLYEHVVISIILSIIFSPFDIDDICKILTDVIYMFFIPYTANQASSENKSVKLDSYWNTDQLPNFDINGAYLLYRLEVSRRQQDDYKEYETIAALSYIGKMFVMLNEGCEKGSSYYDGSVLSEKLKNLSGENKLTNSFEYAYHKCVETCSKNAELINEMKNNPEVFYNKRIQRSVESKLILYFKVGLDVIDNLINHINSQKEDH